MKPNEEKFIRAIAAEGFEPDASEPDDVVLSRAVAFARERATEVGESVAVAHFSGGTFAQVRGRWTWEEMPDIPAERIPKWRGTLEILATHGATLILDTISELGYVPSGQKVGTVYAKIDVYEDGRAALKVVDESAREAGALEGLFERAHFKTVCLLHRKPRLTRQEARAMAEQLPKRLEESLSHVTRPTRGGRRVTKRGGWHGLSDADLARFAMKSLANEQHGMSPGPAREKAATEVGVPPSWGGKTRAEQLRRLYRKGVALLPNSQNQTDNPESPVKRAR